MKNNKGKLSKLGYTDISGEKAHKTVISPRFSPIKEKSFFCGNIEERYRYNPPLPIQKDIFTKEKRDKYHKDKDKKQKSKGEKRKKDTFRRSTTRRNSEIRRIVNANVLHKKKASFFTLTYSQKRFDEYKARKEFNYFIKELRRRFPYNDLDKYLCIVERQMCRMEKYDLPQGVIHFHVIFFECQPIRYQDVNKLWHYGTTDIHQLRSIKNIGSYLASYLTEESGQLDGKVLLTSQNLLKYHEVSRTKYTGFTPGYKFLYSNVYQQKYIKKDGTEFIRDIQITVFLKC